MFKKHTQRLAIALFGLALCCCLPAGAAAQSQNQNSPGILSTADQSNIAAKIDLPSPWAGGPEKWTSPEGLSSTLQVTLLMSVLSLAPAIMLMTTCFVRVLVVLGILRQALGTQQLPPTQVLTAVSLFLTLLIMWPVWKQTYDQGVVPYTQKQLSAGDAWQRGVQPIRRFMSAQIDRCGNSADIWTFYKYLPAGSTEPKSYDDVPLAALLPAFMISELKTAFLIGFQIYLPFVVLDLVVASVTIGMGMLMLPPVLISAPFKLLLFVLVDGWHLVVEMLLQSFQSYS
jgi:flagellar biosynthesis protein FliP